MIKGLTPAGIGKLASVEDYVKLAGAYGFAAVDTDGETIDRWIQTSGVEYAREVLAENRVQLGSIGLPVEWRLDEPRFRDSLRALARHADAASRLGGTVCCTYILPSTDLPPLRFMAAATRRLRACAQILDAYGMKLGLEFVGPHHLRTQWKHPFLWEMADIREWIGAIGEGNVGLLLDSYHWYTTGADAAQLAALRPEDIVHVHLNDAPNVPVEQVLDNDRLYPGEGVIDLAAFLRTLRQIGYTGIVAQEILTPAPPTEPAEALAAKSRDAYRRVFAAAGLE